MGAFVIVLREAFEASLVLGIVFAFLHKTGLAAQHGRAVWLGTASAAALSAAVGALLFATVGELEGTAEQLYEGVAMLIAAVVVTWMVFWLRKQARTIGGALRAQVGDAVAHGGGLALAGRVRGRRPRGYGDRPVPVRLCGRRRRARYRRRRRARTAGGD